MLIVTAEQNRDHVKAGRCIMFVVSGKPGEGGFADLPLLEGGHCKLRDAVGDCFAAFDLYEDKGVAILGDDIDFTTLATEIALDNRKTDSLQECSCQLFAATADPGILQPFAISPSHGST